MNYKFSSLLIQKDNCINILLTIVVSRKKDRTLYLMYKQLLWKTFHEHLYLFCK